MGNTQSNDKSWMYGAYLHADISDSAAYLYVDLRRNLLGGIVADARRRLGHIAKSDGYCERRRAARDAANSLKAHKRLVLALLNKAAWLDDEGECCCVSEERRAVHRRDYRKAMLDVAKTCREIADLVGEGVA